MNDILADKPETLEQLLDIALPPGEDRENERVHLWRYLETAYLMGVNDVFGGQGRSGSTGALPSPSDRLGVRYRVRVHE